MVCPSAGIVLTMSPTTPQSDKVRIEELEQTVDNVQQRLQTVERDNIPLLLENKPLHDLHDERLIKYGEQVQDLKEENRRLKSQLAKSEEGMQDLQQRVKGLEHSNSRLTKLHHDIDNARWIQTDALHEQMRILKHTVILKTSPPSPREIDRYSDDSDEINAARERELQSLNFRFAELKLQEEACATVFVGIDNLLHRQDPNFNQAAYLLERLPEVLQDCDLLLPRD